MLKIRGYRSGTNQQGLPPIIQHAGDVFDYTQGDLVRYGDTVLSKLKVSLTASMSCEALMTDLKIDNEHVIRILINQNSIEKVFIAPSIREANADTRRLLQEGIPQVQFITADCFSASGTTR